MSGLGALWLIYAIIGVIIFSISQIIDKICIDNIFKSIRGWLIASAALSTVPLAFLIFSQELMLDLAFWTTLIAISSGVLQITAYYFYAKAMETEGADIISVLWQVLPLYGCIFGVFMLGEVMSPLNLAGLCLTVLFASWISLPAKRKALLTQLIALFRKPAFLYMQAACILTLISTLIIDQLTIHHASSELLFYYLVGYISVGVFLSIFALRDHGHLLRSPQTLKSILYEKRKTLMIIIMAMGSLECLENVGNYLHIEAYRLGDYAPVTAINALQPFFILLMIYGCRMIRHFPAKKLDDLICQEKTLAAKIPAFSGVFIGVYMMLI